MFYSHKKYKGKKKKELHLDQQTAPLITDIVRRRCLMGFMSFRVGRYESALPLVNFFFQSRLSEAGFGLLQLR